MDYSKLIDIGSKISLAVVLIVILYCGSTGMWVFGSQYKEALAERDTWKALALKGTKIAEQASQQIITGAHPIHTTPLPIHPTPTDVEDKLNKLAEKTKPLTEPLPEDRMPDCGKRTY